MQTTSDSIPVGAASKQHHRSSCTFGVATKIPQEGLTSLRRSVDCAFPDRFKLVIFYLNGSLKCIHLESHSDQTPLARLSNLLASVPAIVPLEILATRWQ